MAQRIRLTMAYPDRSLGDDTAAPPVENADAVAAARKRLETRPDRAWIREHGPLLVLGRGPFSGAPLYYRTHPVIGPVATASSLRRLVDRRHPAVDPAGLRDYLCYGFVPAPRTLLAGIGSVPPGTAIVIDRRTGTRKRVVASVEPPAVGTNVGERFWSRLVERVGASGATGLLLSGGLDSAAVAVAACEAGLRVRAYHARFPAIPLKEDEESRAARHVASHLGLEYREIAIGSWRSLRLFGSMIEALDQPLGDPVALPFFTLFADAAARGERLLLTGEGGDQLFGSWATKPMLVREAYRGNGYERPLAYLESFHKFADEYRTLMASPQLERLPPDDDATDPIVEAFSSSPAAELREQLRWTDIRLKGMQHILPRIAAMADRHRLKLAHPLFDAELLRLSFALAPSERARAGCDKPLLRRLLAARLPPAVLERRKAGMGVPTSVWFARGLRPLGWRWLRPGRLHASGLLDRATVRALLRQELRPRDGRLRRWGDRLWQLCVLEAWYDSLAPCDDGSEPTPIGKRGPRCGA